MTGSLDCDVVLLEILCMSAVRIPMPRGTQGNHKADVTKLLGRNPTLASLRGDKILYSWPFFLIDPCCFFKILCTFRPNKYFRIIPEIHICTHFLYFCVYNSFCLKISL